MNMLLCSKTMLKKTFSKILLHFLSHSFKKKKNNEVKLSNKHSNMRIIFTSRVKRLSLA